MKEYKREVVDYMEVVHRNLMSIATISYALGNNVEEYYEPTEAAEAWHEIEQSEKVLLWKATSDGGVFTTDERTFLNNCSGHLKVNQ